MPPDVRQFTSDHRDAWLRYAAHGSEMARSVRDVLGERLRIAPMFPVEANSAFFDLPAFLRAEDVARLADDVTAIARGLRRGEAVSIEVRQ